MKKRDEFEKFEYVVSDWINRHKTSLYIIGVILAIWITISLAIVHMAGLVGASTYEVNIDDRYQNGEIEYDEYNWIQSYVMPVLICVFRTSEWFITCAWFLIWFSMAYLIIRKISRYRRDEL